MKSTRQTPRMSHASENTNSGINSLSSKSIARPQQWGTLCAIRLVLRSDDIREADMIRFTNLDSVNLDERTIEPETAAKFGAGVDQSKRDPLSAKFAAILLSFFRSEEVIEGIDEGVIG